MAANPPANLYFLPWTRQGATNAIAAPDLLGGGSQSGAARIGITVSINATPVPQTTVQLRGPSDVIGIDANQIVRTDPRAGSIDFESNCFPAIEFDRPDFPWLFTPAKANGDSKLRPWLCLVVIRRQAGVTLGNVPGALLPVLQIAAPANPSLELPDLKDSWAWAHTQAAATGSSSAEIAAALTTDPALSLSRLICPRALAADTDYIACVVPTFELGRRAGLGMAIGDDDIMTNVALAAAWTLQPNMPLPVRLPVYFSWEFRTGPGGDFAALAQKLRGVSTTSLGRREVNIGHLNFEGVPTSATVSIEGALKPVGAAPSPIPWTGEVAARFEQQLAGIVNQPGLAAMSDPQSDPLLAPPLYGRWHAARTTVTAQAANWFDELNLDPRWRAVAAMGTRVVQQQQEALMASAWEQAAALPQINERLRRVQLSYAVNERLHARHLKPIVDNAIAGNEEMLLRIAAPAFSLLRVPGIVPQGRTLTATLARTPLPVPATQTAMRRIGRQRGPLTRRLAAQGFTRLADNSWVARLSYGGATPAPPPPAAVFASLGSLRKPQDVTQAAWHRSFQIVAENEPLPPLPAIDLLPGDWDYPGHFRAAAADHLQRLRPTRLDSNLELDPMVQVAAYVLEQMHPRRALSRLVRAAITTGPSALPATSPGIAPLGCETVLMSPSFPQPMHEPLQELSQDALLPGIADMPPNSVAALETNTPFVEAYMTGLNFEMGRELLWRGFPTDQQGTYFRQFWAADVGEPDREDIHPLQRNPLRGLGVAASGGTSKFVLLMRSDLLRRYPNTVIYLSPITRSSAGTPPDLYPKFGGSLDPDIRFLGFQITPSAAKGNGTTTGYELIIQQHPTEPRFGLDAGLLPPSATHLAIDAPPPGLPAEGSNYLWGRNAGHMAGITRRQPIRIAIRVAQLLS